MKRWNFKKSEFAIYVIAIMLVAAGYFNYINFNLEDKSVSANVVSEENNKNANVGDAVLVSNNEIEEDYEEKNENNSVEDEEEKDEIKNINVDLKENDEQDDSENYYATSKLDREKMYAEMITNYESILNNPNVSEVQKNIATEEIIKINNAKNAIMISENLIISKGFKNCVIFVNDNSINVIINKNQPINAEDVAKIQNIIMRELGIEIGNIHVAEK